MKKLIVVIGLLACGLAPLLAPVGTLRAQESVEITFVHIFPDERDVRRSTIEEIAAAFPTNCPNCYAQLEAPPRGVTSITCEFCGTVVTPEANSDGGSEQ